MDDELNVKIVVIGDGAVGKTCMLVSFTEKKFPMEYVPTVFDNKTTAMTVDDKAVHLQLIDTAGSEKFVKIRPMNYPGTDIFLVCFSINSKSSFDHVTTKWDPEIREHCPKVPFILVGTKADLRDEKKTDKQSNSSSESMIPYEEGERLAASVGAARYMECSALTLDNLDKVFEEAVRIVLPDETSKWCQLL